MRDDTWLDTLSDTVITGDATDMPFIPNDSIDMIITSPPYNSGIEYNQYDDSRDLLVYYDFISRCVREWERVLTPGGRLAINIANIGRRPYIDHRGKVMSMCEALGLMPRGEVIWDKSASVGSSTAWGSWLSASNPSLRDVHEYILVFSKGGYHKGYAGVSTITSEQFLEWTKSIWRIPTASAKGVGHPSPFPIELPARLIQLYTYAGDIVLDPMCGGGNALIAAKQAGRIWLGVDSDPEYVGLARERVGLA